MDIVVTIADADADLLLRDYPLERDAAALVRKLIEGQIVAPSRVRQRQYANASRVAKLAIAPPEKLAEVDAILDPSTAKV